MTILELVKETVEACGAHPAYIKAAEAILQAEKNGAEEFKAEKFGSMRERVKILIPFAFEADPVGCSYLNIWELIFARHENNVHGANEMHYLGEDTVQREYYLEATMSVEEVEKADSVSTREWWSN